MTSQSCYQDFERKQIEVVLEFSKSIPFFQIQEPAKKEAEAVLEVSSWSLFVPMWGHGSKQVSPILPTST